MKSQRCTVGNAYPIFNAIESKIAQRPAVWLGAVMAAEIPDKAAGPTRSYQPLRG
jgi:hypothetical protein